MFEHALPKNFATHGYGYGKLEDRDQLAKADKLILIQRQHNRCALCGRQLLSTQRKEVSHIISKNTGGMCYDRSPIFPDAVLPQVCYCHRHCNLEMGYDAGLWQAQVAGYYGFDFNGLNVEKITEKARKVWEQTAKRPKLYPFWLIKPSGEPIFLTDGEFNEQQYFRQQIETYEPFKEQDGALIPIGLGKSRF